MNAKSRRVGSNTHATETAGGTETVQCVTAARELPDEEWDFESVPADELEACFWWEYLRTGMSKSFFAECQTRWRTAPKTINDGSFLMKVIREFGGLEPFPSLDALYRFTRRHTHSFSVKLARQLGRRPADFFFERGSWLRLPEIVRKNLSWRFYGTIHAARVEPMMAGKKYFFYQEGLLTAKDKAGVNRVSESYFQVKVDWRFKNEEIFKEIQEILAHSRPPEWPERTRRFGRSRFSELFGPTTHRAALRWLGVLRRFEAGCKWSQFEDHYGVATAETDLRKQARCAKAIVAWMKDGNRGHLACLPAPQTERQRAKK